MTNRVPALVPVRWAFLMAVGLAVVPGMGRGADHMDSPRVKTDGRVDINDVYIFQSPTDRRHTVLVMTVNPLAGITSPTTFRPDTEGAAYEFKINYDGHTVEDVTFTITFSQPDQFGVQQVTLIEERANGTGGEDPGVNQDVVNPEARRGGPGRRNPGRPGGGSARGPGNQEPPGGRVIARGQTGRNIRVRDGGTLRADLFDDPFFFDLDAFHRFEDTQNPGEFCNTTSSDPGLRPHNFFAGFNVSAIVLELPSTRLQQRPRNPRTGVWARTLVNGTQFDRMGRPAINTILNSKLFTGSMVGQVKDAFNSGIPRTDRQDFGPSFVAALKALGNNDPQATANFLLPDVLTFDTSKRDGFPNGRRLADDVIDIELNLLTSGALKTDCVGNDSAFRSRFPYLAPPNPVTPH